MKQLIKNDKREWPDEIWILLDSLLTVDQFERITANDALKLRIFNTYEPPNPLLTGTQAFPLYLISSKRKIDRQIDSA